MIWVKALFFTYISHVKNLNNITYCFNDFISCKIITLVLFQSMRKIDGVNVPIFMLSKNETLEKYDNDYLYISQGAFGSGEHETTKSCLNKLKYIDIKGKRVLDIGCGTGILGIMAEKMGAAFVVGFDISFDACKTADCNFRLNRCRVNNVICGDHESINGKFDLVIANIYFDIIISLYDFIKRVTSGDSHVILSGIPVENNFDTRRKYCDRRDFVLIKNEIMEEFSTVVLKRAISSGG